MLINIKKIHFKNVNNVIIKIENLNKKIQKVFICKSTHEKFDLNYYN